MDSPQAPDTGSQEVARTDWDRPKRWSMTVPWKPEIPDKERVRLARQWLEFLDLDVTEEQVKKIKRHVMLYHPLSPKGQVANELVRRDDTPPSRTAVEQEYPRWVQRVRERDQEQGRELLSDPSIPGRVCDFITTYRAAHGVGPFWREVAYELDLPSTEAVAVVLDALKLAGYITFTIDEHSLDVTKQK